MTDPTHVLVTGGAGFIGSHLVDLLLERGDTVTVLDKLTYAGAKENLTAHERSSQLRFVQGDVAEPSAVEPLVAAADGGVHVADARVVGGRIEGASGCVESAGLRPAVRLVC